MRRQIAGTMSSSSTRRQYRLAEVALALATIRKSVAELTDKVADYCAQIKQREFRGLWVYGDDTSGYKPLGNYQDLLYKVVADRLKVKVSDLFDRAALAAVQMPAAAPLPADFAKVLVEPPKFSYSAGEPTAPKIRSAVKRDYIDREARNASLGQAGEEFVVHYERWRLISGGYERLANKVEHVAKTQGDGLGYDVLSFDTTGKHRLIEVKTTSFGKETPFFITRNEVDLSRSEVDHFHLYRLFDFRKEPHLFSFRGPVDKHCHLDPITFQAHFS